MRAGGKLGEEDKCQVQAGLSISLWSTGQGSALCCVVFVSHQTNMGGLGLGVKH